MILSLGLYYYCSSSLVQLGIFKKSWLIEVSLSK